jgi:hypothetical protein
MDKWFTSPVLGEPFDPIGLPNTGSVDFPWPGLVQDCIWTVFEEVFWHNRYAQRDLEQLDAAT